jgi:large subunit ribosomal protein L3
MEMHKGLLGRKLGMSSFFLPEGTQVPVTVLEVGPCVVTQVKTRESDGYDAVQVGFVEKKKKGVSKPLQGHLNKSGGQAFAFLKEIPTDDPSSYTPGQSLTVDMFQVGEFVEVSGTSKGRGFTGVIKRWGFSGGRKTHGSMFHRAPGSVGCSAWPSRIIKGRKMPGQHGNRRVTVRNLKVVDVRPENHLLLVRGAVPGSKMGLVEIKKPKFSK